ncbi:protein FAM111A-like isoform X2 [Echeneis naucrates]|uniref:Protein FAM111A-like n=2 Tax=Echeneis naucrates TaxID=173247 RepID=A0A665T4N7_ECHNA|nr:protein FAM111A-like isoform X2 [Echeneis naucrates]
MPRKKQKTTDIRINCTKDVDHDSSSTQETLPGGAAASQTFTGCEVKEENSVDGGHSHHFTVKFSSSARKEHTVSCHQPCTVLEAIKSLSTYKEKVKCADENLVIQLGKNDKERIVATHFPCCHIDDGACLIVLSRKGKIEQAPVQQCPIVQPGEKYSVFYIDTEGGKNTKTKTLFRSNSVKKFKYLCVYGEKGATVKEALKRDGRFIDELDEFHLSDNADPNNLIFSRQTVDNLDLKSFKICLPRSTKKVEGRQGKKSVSNPANMNTVKSVLEVVQQKGISAVHAVKKIWQQRPNFLRKNFGKAPQPINEVYKVEKLITRSKSVCKVVVKDVCQGTGFVLFDNLILTNAHLISNQFNSETSQVHGNVFALFDYDKPDPDNDYYYFACQPTVVDYDEDLDYAILELNTKSLNYSPKTRKKKPRVPPGLLKTFGPVPLNGEVCIFGHPRGELKKMDATFIIEKENRKKAVDDYLEQFQGSPPIIHSIRKVLADQGIKNILIGGNKADRVVTYHTAMFGGSSGSALFDAHDHVVGLHTAGYISGVAIQEESVIEYAHPVLLIFKSFVNNMKRRGNDEMMKRIKKEARGNRYLRELVGNPEEVMEVDEV